LAAADRIVVNFHKQPTSVTRGDFEAGKTQAGSNIDTPLDIPELSLELRQDPIVAKTRKLKAKWTPEFAQDLNAYQNIDAEAELTGILGEYISQEIDLELLDMLLHDAQHTDYWSTRIGWEYNGSSFSPITQNLTAYTQGTWFQTLGTKIQKMSNRIHQATVRGGANFLVCSPLVATILESIPGYAADTDGNQVKFSMGVQKVGQINNRFQVYKNPYMTDNVILVGFRGNNFLETGAVYAPYIPLYKTYMHANTNSYGFVVTVESDNVLRYTYDPQRDGDINALEEIEKKGLIILDDNEEEMWIDAISPENLKRNVENLPKTPTVEDIIRIMQLEKLKLDNIFGRYDDNIIINNKS
jgi:hypothetical protein